MIAGWVLFMGLFFGLLPSFFHEGIEWYDYLYLPLFPFGETPIKLSFVPIFGLMIFVAVFLGLPILFLKGLLVTFKPKKKGADGT